MIDRRFLLTMKRAYAQLADDAGTLTQRRAYRAIAADIDRMLAA